MSDIPLVRNASLVELGQFGGWFLIIIWALGFYQLGVLIRSVIDCIVAHKRTP